MPCAGVVCGHGWPHSSAHGWTVSCPEGHETGSGPRSRAPDPASCNYASLEFASKLAPTDNLATTDNLAPTDKFTPTGMWLPPNCGVHRCDLCTGVVSGAGRGWGYAEDFFDGGFAGGDSLGAGEAQGAHLFAEALATDGGGVRGRTDEFTHRG